MSYTVGQVSGLAGVTVRTLHHYDRAGLLSPGGRSPGGYHLYDDADLARLQQILFYRELGFALDEIAEILADPRADALDQLKARRRALRERIGQLERLVEVAERAMEVQRTGVALSPQERFEVFGEITFDLSYATEAELKWQGSPGYREAMESAAAHSKEGWARLMGEAARWREELLAAFDAGEPPGGRAGAGAGRGAPAVHQPLVHSVPARDASADRGRLRRGFASLRPRHAAVSAAAGTRRVSAGGRPGQRRVRRPSRST